MDYESIISEKFPKCNVEVIQPDFLEIKQLNEYITDDIVVYSPHTVIIYRHLIRFLVNVGEKCKFYYLEGFSEENLDLIHAEILKSTFRSDIKIKLYRNADPDKEVLGL